MKHYLRKAFDRVADSIAWRTYRQTVPAIDINSTRQQQQVLLYHMYREMSAKPGARLPDFKEVGFRCHSQFEEDGILLYIFALLGMTNRKCVEICAGNGLECNATNLILNHGWWGYLFDGLEKNVAQGRRFFADSKDTLTYPPRFTQAWITAENVNSLIADSGVSGEIDLLSLDLDGMDYWIWKAIEVIRPRVVVCETHNIIGPEDALTVPYDPHFSIKVPDFCSVSLAGMVKLGKAKGYRLVGVHRYGSNAFFVLNGLAEQLLPEVTVAQCLTDPFTLEAHRTRWPRVKDMDWVRV